jgi:putative NADPH-quinone reductase
LSKEEHYPSGGKKISSQNKKYQTKIKKADKLIFIYPLWWGSMPAILKGFFDRILTPGFGYYYKKNGLPEKLLKGKKAAVFITSGSPIIYNELLQDRFTFGISKDILNFCGIKNKVFQIDKATKLTDAQKKKVKDKVNKGINYLFK